MQEQHVFALKTTPPTAFLCYSSPIFFLYSRARVRIQAPHVVEQNKIPPKNGFLHVLVLCGGVTGLVDKNIEIFRQGFL